MSEHDVELSPDPGDAAETPQALDKLFTIDEDGVELFDMDAVIPSKRRWKVGDRVYEIPNSVPIELMLEFVHYEEGGTRTSEENITKLAELERKIRDFVAEHNENVPASLNLGTTRLPLAISYLMGGKTATEFAVDALMGGSLQKAEATLREAIADAEKEGRIDPAEREDDGEAPLASPEPSSPPSSRSQKSTGGSPAGGGKKRRARSSSTSPRAAAKT